ncbi:MAG: hypothetical protein AAFV86_21415, partial [Pseudomonadota bacterium]
AASLDLGRQEVRRGLSDGGAGRPDAVQDAQPPQPVETPHQRLVERQPRLLRRVRATRAAIAQTAADFLPAEVARLAAAKAAAAQEIEVPSGRPEVQEGAMPGGDGRRIPGRRSLSGSAG